MTQLKTNIDVLLKTAFRNLATTRNMTEAALLRHLATEATAVKPPNFPEVPAPRVLQQTTTITVYLPAFLKIAVTHRAKGTRMTASEWVASLIQSNLMKEPVMSHNQLLALNSSIRELSAIGRNINQITRALNERPGDQDLVKLEQLAALHAQIENSKNAFRHLVRSSQRAWGQS